MTQIFVCRVCIVLVLSLANSISWADLNSPIYKSAKEAYTKGDWADALKLLQQYANEDTSFLSANPAAKEAIAKAIFYCEDKVENVILIAGGVIGVPAAKPTLP